MSDDGDKAGKRCRGITLIELLVVIAIALALLWFAIPRFTHVTTSAGLTTGSNLLVAHMQLARSEAIKRGTPVTLCPSGDGVSCAKTYEWSLGWMVFVDSGTPGEVDGGDLIIAVSPNVEGDVTLQATHIYMRFLQDGALELPDT